MKSFLFILFLLFYYIKQLNKLKIIRNDVLEMVKSEDEKEFGTWDEKPAIRNTNHLNKTVDRGSMRPDARKNVTFYKNILTTVEEIDKEKGMK